MLVGHIDVVPAFEKQFTLREENGKLYGRGVYDMKSGIAGYLAAIDELEGSLSDYDFGIMITTDEETQDLGVKTLLNEGFCPTEAAVLLDGAYDWKLAKSAKGAIYLNLRIEDKIGHGSRPWLVNSSSMRMVSLLGELQTHFANAGPETNTLNINMLRAGAPGEAYNQIPATTLAGLDIRIISHEERERIVATIGELCKKYGATWEVIVEFAALAHNMNDPHMQSFAKHIYANTGVSGSVMSLAASDASHFIARGVECMVTYPIGGGHHSAEEWIDAKSLHDITPIITGYLQDMAHLKTEALVEPRAATH